MHANHQIQLEPSVNTNELGVVAFACDLASSRLCVGLKRRVLILRRVPSRFELLSVSEVAGVPAELGWVVERIGMRWLCVSSDESLSWLNTDVKQTQSEPNPAEKLPPASQISPGRHADEVMLVRGDCVSFCAPREASPRAQLTMKEAVLVAGLVCPLVLCLLASSNEVVLALDSGQVLHSFRLGRPLLRWQAAFGAGCCCLGTSALIRPAPDLPDLLAARSDFAGALVACDALGWDSAKPDPALKRHLKGAYAKHLLTQPGGCAAPDVTLAAELLHGEARLGDVLGLFAATDLFAGEDEVVALGGKPERVKFKPGGALALALRLILLPLLLAEPARSPLLDSVSLRALVLGRPGKKESAQTQNEYSSAKAKFLSESNFCSVAESERLLLSFPEMWEDHALLLASKGEHAKALEWLRTLGLNAQPSDDRYARASVELMRPQDVAEFAGWILSKHPAVGVEALAKACLGSALTLDEALDLARPHEVPLLERLVDRGVARDRLALEYLRRDQRELLAGLLGGGDLDWAALVEPLEAKGWQRELATALDKLGHKHRAVEVLLDLDPARAEAYAAVSGDKALVGLVFDWVLRRSGSGAALAVAERAQGLIDVVDVLHKLGDDVPLSAATGLVRQELQRLETRHRDHLVVRQLAKQEHLLAMQEVHKLRAQYVVMDKDRRCIVCGRGFKADSAFVRQPGKLAGEVLLRHASCAATAAPS